MPTAYFSHLDCQQHDMGRYHPECPERLRAISRQLSLSGLLQELRQISAPLATDEILLLAHTGEHLQRLLAKSPEIGRREIDADTALNPFSINAARRAAGAVTAAIEEAMHGVCKRAFCAVRPPGHHAESELPMGFCLFNNIAIGARHALVHLGVERVAILDFDVHHGNGTVEIFRDDPRVLVCSSFQYPFYPYRYQQVKRDHIVNTPLAAGTNSLQYRNAVEGQWLPALERFRPELILVSAGFDAHEEDPLADLRLVDEDYGWLADLICSVAGSYAEGRIVAALEGGYNLQALARSCQRFIAGLHQLQ